MPKGSAQLTAARRNEILDACERLFAEKPYADILLRDIADGPTFTRPSIYNYFQSKEEIFLALLEREYRLWSDDLEAILSQQTLTRAALADRIAKTIEKRTLMLKILSVNIFELEENSRLESLVDLKVAYGWSRMVMQDIVRRFLPGMTRDERNDTVFAIFEFIHGIWPYAHATEKQRLAMKQAGVSHSDRTVYQIACSGILRLLSI